MSSNTIGKIGEQHAYLYLKKKGYKIIQRNFKIRFGEIDLICRDGKTIVFVEVKCRVGDLRGKPHEAFRFRKQQKIKRVAYFYLKKENALDNKLRIDVVSVKLNPDTSIDHIKHYVNVNLKAGCDII